MRAFILEQMQAIIDMEARVAAHGLPKDAANMRALKSMGFSDVRLGDLTKKDVSGGGRQLILCSGKK